MAAEMDQTMRETAQRVTGLWWLWLASGIAWVVIALVVLQFDDASISTVGVLIGLMFLLSGFQQLGIAMLADRWKLVWAFFGVLLLAAGVISLISPEDTFAGVADILGFLFLLVGVMWTFQAFSEKDANPLWWFGLIAGVLMIVLAFWTSGQFLIEKQYILLVFAGVWALMQGVTDIVKAFAIRAAHEELVR